MEDSTKKVHALSRIIELMREPNETLKNLEKMTEYMGAFNELIYGINPYEKKTKEKKHE